MLFYSSRSSVLISLMLLIAACNPAVQEEFRNTTLMIGDLEWTVRNLNVSTFRNGDPIPEARTDQEWTTACQEGDPAWCYYNNDPANSEKYGRLYNQYAVKDPRGLCPEGWHIPTYGEWQMLVNSIGSEAGLKMKTASGWKENGSGTNESGFTAFPGGSRYGNGGFYGMGDYAVFGTSDGGNFYLTKWGSLRGGSSRGYGSNGLSLRCVRRKLYDGFDIVPAGVPNKGIMFVNHEATGRSGHSFSTLTECQNGDILAFYGNTSGIIHGGHTTMGWTEYKRSRDGGKTWGDPAVFEYSKKVWDENRKTDGTSPKNSLVMSVETAPNGNLVAIVMASGPTSPLYLLSYDNGYTWSEPKILDTSATKEEVYRPRNTTFIHDGTLYVAFIGEEIFGEETLYASEDNGETFTRRSSHLFAGRTYTRNVGYITGNVLDDGRFIIYGYQGTKGEEHNAPYVISEDNGYTWSEVRYTYFEKKIRHPQMSGKVGDYYFLTSRSGSYGVYGGHLVLYKSKDGINWDSGVILNTEGGTSDSYSANKVIGKYDQSTPDRLLIQSSIIYTGSRVNLKHWWIENISGTSMDSI